jgi:DNA-binding CsgD family transcriptional regulator
MHLYETFLSADTYAPGDISAYRNIEVFADEAVYIYSLVDMKICYADGFDSLLGYDDKEISMRLLVSITTPDFADFIQEMNNESLAFILGQREYLNQYCCTIESKKYNKWGEEVSLIESVRVYKTEGSRVTEVLGRYKLNPRVPNPRFKYFHATGPGINNLVERMREFEGLEKNLTKRQQEVLILISQGKLIKEIADQLLISKSSIEKIIRTMCKKFEVNSSKELIAYALKNQLL